jgi:hypothetical protein
VLWQESREAICLAPGEIQSQQGFQVRNRKVTLSVQVGLRHGLPISSPVDDAGAFTEEAAPFAGAAVALPPTAADCCCQQAWEAAVAHP